MDRLCDMNTLENELLLIKLWGKRKYDLVYLKYSYFVLSINVVSADHYVLCIECVTESMDTSKFCFRDINNFDTVLNHHLTSNIKFGSWSKTSWGLLLLIIQSYNHTLCHLFILKPCKLGEIFFAFVFWPLDFICLSWLEGGRQDLWAACQQFTLNECFRISRSVVC